MSVPASARSTCKTRRRSSHPCWTTRLLGRYSSLASARPRSSCRSAAGGWTGLRSFYAIRVVYMHNVAADGTLRLFFPSHPLVLGEISPCGVSTRSILGSVRLQHSSVRLTPKTSSEVRALGEPDRRSTSPLRLKSAPAGTWHDV
jgi:hypothetical protein